MEEATASSRLEGAVMTVPKAKEMLRTGRKPRNKSEQMILNNYLTMRQIEGLKDRPLTPQLVLDLHRSISEGTLDDPDAAGRLRLSSEKVEVVDSLTQEIAHVPPPAEELAERLATMCAFANRQLDMNEYLPPVLRAIILHFWLAYDHPFVDGNGRTARALFYWSALRDGYGLFKFVSISSMILAGSTKYARAFLYTETDDNDLTYFIIYHLEILKRSLEELDKYIERKLKELRGIEHRMHGLTGLNHRQKALLANALRHPHQHYTFDSHAHSHNVVKQTARTDLLALCELGLLKRGKDGRRFYFVPAADIAARLGDLDSSVP
jgi:Fic family protein